MDEPPPIIPLKDDPAAADQARARFSTRPKLRTLFSSSSPAQPPIPADPVVELIDTDHVPISLDSSALVDHGNDQDLYQWAVLYENQRGITVFSIPYYSSASLLPSDPSPFTLPNALPKRSKQPPVTLDTYPLPDGNWRWVSRCWMIDMRSDSGQVQHDGFEYNWMFRRHHWRPHVGSFNAGGWVRRRRWVRLMVRPARPKTDELGNLTPTTPSIVGSERLKRRSIALSLPPSVNTGTSAFTDNWAFMDPDDVWLPNDVEGDWQRCRAAIKYFPTDGQKLELWRLWLGVYHPEHKGKFLTVNDKGKRREKQWSEDDAPLPSEISAAHALAKESVAIAPKDRIVAIIRSNLQHILRLFVFPESRAQFLRLIGKANVLSDVNLGLGLAFSSSEIDFWSYTKGLPDNLKLNVPVPEVVAGDSLSINDVSTNLKEGNSTIPT